MIASAPPFFQVALPHERALVRVLIMAHRRRLNRAVMVDRLANEFKRWPGRSLRQVARLLADETPLIDALEQSPRALNPAAVMSLRLAMETGTFPEQLESLVAGDVTPDLVKSIRRRDAESQLIQAGVGFLFTSFVFLFLMTFIIPTMEKMYEEFGMMLPSPMLLLIAIGNYFVNGWGVLIWLLFLFVAMGAIVFGNTGRMFGWGSRMPHRRSDLLALLALVVQSGRPLVSGIGTLSRVHPIGRFRSRLVSVASAIAGGEEGWRALAEKKFLTIVESRALQRADDPLAQAWLLRRAARSRLYSSDSRVSLIFRTISLVSMLCLAALVMLAAVSMFMTVYGLVDGLAFVGDIR